MIYTVRTTVGRENTVVNNIVMKAKQLEENHIKAVFHPAELKGYIFVEGDLDQLTELVKTIPHVRGIIKKEVKIDELKKFLEAKKTEIKINKGDIVEIIGGSFKNEKGKVTRVDEAKGELTIEFLDAAVPIPITISVDMVRVLERAEGE
ncbi:MAG: transcription elongation factor Spt5 [Candidatus Aenigmarchaeota archaeon]|nr:transcription elongation factor Spt5 [Candidatus Aenigmarchaeota archaeon]